VDKDACIGETDCGNCKEACPYDAPQFGEEENAKMQKCNLCVDRWQEENKPVCVEACPMRALDAGPLDELRSKYGDVRETAGLEYSSEAQPSITFKQKVRLIKSP
jgi:anaerobic dimethyl sulfoxide reductase subunit B (iron-sulfur subunit)